MNVYEKLMQVQQRLKAPKSQYNKFGDFHYRSCEDIQEAVKPILAEVKAVLLVSDEVVLIGSRFYIKASAVFQDTENPEAITNIAYAREAEEKPKMDQAQITGSCSSYARKYALNGLFCIDDARDPDTVQPVPQPKKQETVRPTQQTRQQPARPTQQKRITGEQIDTIMYEAARTGTELKKVLERYGVNQITELTQEQFQKAMSAFSKMAAVHPGYDQLNLSDMAKDMPFR